MNAKRIVLTRSVKKSWEQYCEARPTEVFDELLQIAEESVEMNPQPDNVSGYGIVAYQHPEFKSFYFLAAKNEDDEMVFIGTRDSTRSGTRSVANNLKLAAKLSRQSMPAPKWDEQPTDISADALSQWCLKQQAIAFGMASRKEISAEVVNARVGELSAVRKLANSVWIAERRDEIKEARLYEREQAAKFLDIHAPDLALMVRNGKHLKSA